MLSNCWIQGCIAWRLNRDGAKLVFEKTKHKYWFIEMPHCYLWFPETGLELEFVPYKEELGNFPPPLFKGHWRVRHG